MGIMTENTHKQTSIEEQQQQFKNASITVSKKAVKQLKIAMKANGGEIRILRMAVEGGGCSGMTLRPFWDEFLSLEGHFAVALVSIVAQLGWLWDGFSCVLGVF